VLLLPNIPLIFKKLLAPTRGIMRFKPHSSFKWRLTEKTMKERRWTAFHDEIQQSNQKGKNGRKFSHVLVFSWPFLLRQK
jgi:hypothetical protein